MVDIVVLPLDTGVVGQVWVRSVTSMPMPESSETECVCACVGLERKTWRWFKGLNGRKFPRTTPKPVRIGE